VTLQTDDANVYKGQQLITDDFLRGYSNFPAHMDELGKFVYYRTYSRFLNDKKRRETWKETVARAVEYNASLIEGTTREEAEKLFDNIFNLRSFLSGRTFWVGGTEVSRKYPMANFNCAFIVLDSFAAFKDLFYLLMLGTGVGGRALLEDAANFPKVRQDVKIKNKHYRAKAKSARRQTTGVSFRGSRAYITIGDSKEGWVQAAEIYFKIISEHGYGHIKGITFNYDSVRPKGERLSTFGGTASGHESLKNMFTKISYVFNTDKFAPRPIDGELRPIHLLDITTIIGENVVVGGVRRTATIILGSANDSEFLKAKKDLTAEKYHRFMSNNSVYYNEKPTREQLKEQFRTLRYEGEPAFVNAEAARKRRPDFMGVNPCVEILLANYGLCNLTTTNAMAFVSNGILDLDGLLAAHALSARAGYRMTNVQLELDHWNKQQKADRLTGVSVTGWKDAMEAAGFTQEEEILLQGRMHEAARGAADAYADEKGYTRSLLVTAVKPEGTLSQLAGVSSGLHHAHSPYFIRRVRVNAHDPLCKVVEALGWAVKNEVGQGIEVNGVYVPVNTKVIEFPVQSPAKRTKYDVSAAEQLQTYFDFQEHYTEHNSSNTISVKDDDEVNEWEEVEQIVWDKWDDMLAVSFLKLDGHSYELAPYSAITEAEYEERKLDMFRKPFSSFMLTQFENGKGEDFDLGDEACKDGACAVR
jgi:adenosylcobalamin-dependent ribonucleoside-triphosphate reductase